MVNRYNLERNIPFIGEKCTAKLEYGVETILGRTTVLPINIELEHPEVYLDAVTPFRTNIFSEQNISTYCRVNGDVLRYFLDEEPRLRELVPEENGTLMATLQLLLNISRGTFGKAYFLECGLRMLRDVYLESGCEALYITHRVPREHFYRIGVVRDTQNVKVIRVETIFPGDLAELKTRGNIVVPKTISEQGLKAKYTDFVYRRLAGDMDVYDMLAELGLKPTWDNISLITRCRLIIDDYEVYPTYKPGYFELELPIDEVDLEVATDKVIGFLNHFAEK